MSVIHKTRDYDKFKHLPGNRKIEKYPLRMLTQAILKDNQLELHPMIVNTDFGVIDGQHRLEVAKTLGLDIYYIQSDTVTDMHMIDSNVNQKSWALENYISYFAEKERLPDYMELRKLQDHTKLHPKSILALLIGHCSPEFLRFLKTGKFKFPKNLDHVNIVGFYLDFIAYIEDKKITPKAMFKNHGFTTAFRWLLQTNGFEYAILKKKLDSKWFELKPQYGSEGWYKLLISIYNFKNANKIEEEYGSAVAVKEE